MIHHGEKLSLRANTDASSKIEHLSLRLYGALILGQVRLCAAAAQSQSRSRCRALHSDTSLVALRARALQAWITWKARRINDGSMRRVLVQAYWGVFTLTALSLLRAQVTPGGGMNTLNWINIGLFVGLAGCYGWFAFFEKPSAFEGIGKVTV